MLAFGAVTGAATAGVGALAGLAFHTDRWQRVPTRKASARVLLAPTRGGAAVALRPEWR